MRRLGIALLVAACLHAPVAHAQLGAVLTIGGLLTVAKAVIDDARQLLRQDVPGLSAELQEQLKATIDTLVTRLETLVEELEETYQDNLGVTIDSFSAATATTIRQVEALLGEIDGRVSGLVEDVEASGVRLLQEASDRLELRLEDLQGRVDGVLRGGVYLMDRAAELAVIVVAAALLLIGLLGSAWLVFRRWPERTVQQVLSGVLMLGFLGLTGALLVPAARAQVMVATGLGLKETLTAASETPDIVLVRPDPVFLADAGELEVWGTNLLRQGEPVVLVADQELPFLGDPNPPDHVAERLVVQELATLAVEASGTVPVVVRLPDGTTVAGAVRVEVPPPPPPAPDLVVDRIEFLGPTGSAAVGSPLAVAGGLEPRAAALDVLAPLSARIAAEGVLAGPAVPPASRAAARDALTTAGAAAAPSAGLAGRLEAAGVGAGARAALADAATAGATAEGAARALAFVPVEAWRAADSPVLDAIVADRAELEGVPAGVRTEVGSANLLAHWALRALPDDGRTDFRIEEGALARVRLTVRNRGEGAAAGSSVQWIPEPGRPPLTIPVGAVPPGGRRTLEASHTYRFPGRFTMLASADGLFEVEEADEGNNSLAASLTVTEARPEPTPPRRARITVTFDRLEFEHVPEHWSCGDGEGHFRFAVNGNELRWPRSGNDDDWDDGDTRELGLPLHADLRDDQDLVVRAEGWEDDGCGGSGDDAMGVVERVHRFDEAWGRGTHSRQISSCPDGCYLLTYTIDWRFLE